MGCCGIFVLGGGQRVALLHDFEEGRCDHARRLNPRRVMQ